MYENSANHQSTSGSEMQQSQLDFETEFLELLNPKSSDGRLIFAFIRSRLKQFNIQQAYSEACILNEVYLRAIKKMKQGEIIAIPIAWIRATAYNYIRELSRDGQKLVYLENYQNYHRSFLGIEDTEHFLISLIKKEELQFEQTLIRKAFERLPPADRKLLHLKIIRGLSWQQIRDLSEYQKYTLAALRKRKQRALEKLHRLYHFLGDSTEISSEKTPV